MISSIQRLTWHWPIADLNALIEHVHHGQRVFGTAVDAAYRDGSAPAHSLDRVQEGIEAVHPEVPGYLAPGGAGQSADATVST